MFVRWPRYRSHGPAGEMWSVVHLPAAFSSTCSPVKSLPVPRPGTARAAASRSESGFTTIVDRVRVARRRGRSPDSPGSKPCDGSSSALGASSCTSVPSLALDRLAHEVDVEPAGERHRGDRLGRADERQRRRVAVVAGREVAVERRDDRVRLALHDVVALPLPDARAARVGEHGRADRLEVGEQAVALDRGAHLLGAGRDQQRRLHPQALRRRLARDVRGPADVLVARVGARADERGRDLRRVALGLRPPRARPRSAGRGRACAGRRGAARARRGRCRSRGRRTARGRRRPRGRCAGARRTGRRGRRAPRAASPSGTSPCASS